MWVKFQYGKHVYILSLIYRPQWHSNTTGIWDRFQYSLERALDITPNVFITGDVNKDMLHSECNKFFDILTNFNLTNKITSPTRTTETSSKLLDPFIVSDSIETHFAEVMPVDNSISDHDTV